MNTTEHALADITLDAGQHIAWCTCGFGFCGAGEDLARQAWEAHVDRIAHTPRVTTDPDGSEHTEADPVQYGREEDRRLALQLGAYPDMPAGFDL